jgi:hypothetical protein
MAKIENGEIMKINGENMKENENWQYRLWRQWQSRNGI